MWEADYVESEKKQVQQTSGILVKYEMLETFCDIPKFETSVIF